MPHVNAGSSSGGGGGSSSAVGGGASGPSSSSGSSGRIRDDPNDCDEVKVFKCAEDEGEGDSDDVINDDKRDLIRATECDQKGRLSPLSPLSPAFSGGHSSSYSSSKNGHATIRPDPASIFGKSLDGVAHPSPLNMGYLMPYPYANGSPLSSMAEKMRLGAGSLPFFCNGVEGLTQPPPAHMGYHGLSRSAVYPYGNLFPYGGLPEVSQQVASWHAQSMYPISNAGSPGGASAGFRNYPPSLSIPTSIPSDFYRFSPGALMQGPGLGPHPGLGHHLVGTPSKHDAHSSHLDHNHRSSLSDQKSSDTHGSKNASDSGQSSNSQNEKKKPHIKKPLNAFMLYMKEMRAKVVAECTLKESAAINQILGRRWHALGREEQAKYYELARRERQLHMQMYPNWSSAQNRTHHEKKRKKKQDQKFDGGNSMKKCRARYGLDQQSQWCKPCRRKKKCIRYLEEANNGSVNSVNSPDDNLGSAGSAGEPLSPDSKAGDSDMDKSSDMGMSSPSFSLTSPGMNSPGMSMSLPSPALTSPSGVLPSPASLLSPAVSLPSLQSPMTPSMSEDRHPISSVSSSTSSVNFSTTTASSSSNNQNQNNSNSTSTSTITNNQNNHHPHHQNNNSSRNQNNPSPSSSSSSYKNQNQHYGNNSQMHLHHHSTSPQFGFGLGHLFGAGGHPGSMSPNGNLMPGFPVGPLPFPFPLGLQKPTRNPVGANPHDINNPLSVNQLTGQCNSSGGSSSSSASSLSSVSERSNSSQKSHSNNNSNHNNNNNHNYRRGDRSRSRDRDRLGPLAHHDSRDSDKSNENSKSGSAPPVPVIGVS